MTDLTRRDLLRSGAIGAVGLWLPFAADARSATWHARLANERVSATCAAEPAARAARDPPAPGRSRLRRLQPGGQRAL